MVIQRIQTLYLIIAVILLAIFMFVPFGSWSVTEHYADYGLKSLTARNDTSMELLVLAAIFFAVAGIFLFKKTGVQKFFVSLSVISTLVTIGMVIYTLTIKYAERLSDVPVKPEWGAGGLLLAGAVIMLVAAYRAITSDQRLLRSYDRLR